MQVLVTGATGLIGGAVVARLLETGHQVTGVARRIASAPRSVPSARWIALDIAAATEPVDWLPCLVGAEAVVNCAGVFQDGPYDSTRGVHLDGARALFAACERAGVRRVVQVSAIGVDRLAPSDFSRSKIAGDMALMGCDLDWVVLRPSVVLGPAAYGGSALFRGLAALPVLPLMPDSGLLQVVQLEDLVATVLFFLDAAAPSRIALDIAGPDALSLADIVRHYRAWLGCGPAREVALPRPAATILYRLGDIAGWLGWRPPLRSTARAELARGAIGDPLPWREATGIVPRSLAAALAARPASIQERWFFRLYLLKPAVFVVLSLYWIATGLIALGPGHRAALELLRSAGLPGAAAILAGAAADILIGIAIAFRRTARAALRAGLALSLLYLIIGSAILPELWFDPLGPYVKVFPVLVLIVVALAILEDR